MFKTRLESVAASWRRLEISCFTDSSRIGRSSVSRAASAIAASCPVSAAKGGELGSAISHAHLRVIPGNVMRQVDNIRVLVFCLPVHALCPPICSLRSRVVAPASRFIPRRIAFLPNLPLMLSRACCILRSLSSCASSSSFRAASAS